MAMGLLTDCKREEVQDMPVETINCPVCGAAMQKRMVGDGMPIDYCDSHGVWLRRGELEQLLAASGGYIQSEPGVGRSIAQGLAGATVMGAGFSIGQRLVSGIVDSLFSRRT